ncbi:hypothetical protein Tco_0752898 [Tanacetum coccineum]
MTGGHYENTRRQFSSNEDFTKKISHSVFSKAGKRFAFVRFIKVFNLDRLVKNLCTIWIGSYHLFANQVRYDRPQKPLNPNTNVPQKYGSKKDADHRNGSTGSHQKKGGVTSYVSVVNGVTPLVQPGNSLSSAPALVLDEECVVERDFSNCAMGRVKSFDSITKLQSLLVDEGFVNVTLSYLGGLWVMFECDKPDTKRNLVNHVGINSWFQVIQEVNQDFVSDERVVWLDIEGVPLYAWSRKSFDKIGNKWGEVLNIEDSYETSFGRKVYMVRAKELFTWTPSFESIKEHDYSSEDESVQGSMEHSVHVDKEISADPFGLNELIRSKKPVEEKFGTESVIVKPPGVLAIGGSGNNKGGSFGSARMRLIRVGLGSKSKKEWVKELSNNNKLNFIAIQETKMERMCPHMDVELFIVGNSNYDYVLVEAQSGNSWRQRLMRSNLNDLKEMEDMDFVQKAKVRWAIEGDENSKSILVKKAFKDHYEARFNKPTKARLKLSFSFPNRLSTDQVADLERHVSHDEIKLAFVWDCGVNKSPGPDGFTFEFFRKFWKVIGPDFCEAVEHFFKQGSFSKGCNSSFIALIPKVLDAKFVNDYRPISLIGCIYKVRHYDFGKPFGYGYSSLVV